MSTVQMGSEAETIATRLLARKGYRIVERNYRCKSGELDIVARDGGVLCFVEVRSRHDGEHGHAAEMIDRRKQAQVTRVARWYIAERAPTFDRARFDVVAITGDETLLIRDAWRA